MVKEYHTSLLEGPPEPTKRNPAIIIMTQLLTPSDVAELLQISVRTVYDHARRLGDAKVVEINKKEDME